MEEEKIVDKTKDEKLEEYLSRESDKGCQALLDVNDGMLRRAWNEGYNACYVEMSTRRSG